MIVLFVNKQRKFDTERVEILKSICQKAMDEVVVRPFVDRSLHSKSTCLSVTITFVGADHMRKTNYQYREINKLTDVLSFPLLDMHNGKLVHPLGAQDILWHKDGIGEIALGDVLISLDKASEQAEQIGHSLEREVAFLTIHAGLHLLGFDHIDPEDEKRMITEQKRIVKSLIPDEKQSESEEKAVSDSGVEDISDDRSSEYSKASAVKESMWNKEEERINTLPHSGFAAIIGKPNVGKSTLINQLSGMKLSIVSPRPQTTRNNVRAIINRDNAQVLFVDTPGVQKPQNELSKFMADSSVYAARYADVIVLMVDGRFSRPGESDRAVVERIAQFHKPVILVINKADAVVKESLLPIIEAYARLFSFHSIIPLSSKTGDGIDHFMDEVIALLPPGPRYYPEEDYTDQSERSLSAELIREQILHYTDQEVPHGTAVLIDQFEEIGAVSADDSEREMVKIYASIICERKSHKSIILGKNGQMIKRIGTAARRNIESMTGCKVYLELHVKVRTDWKNAESHLNELGYKPGDISGKP